MVSLEIERRLQNRKAVFGSKRRRSVHTRTVDAAPSVSPMTMRSNSRLSKFLSEIPASTCLKKSQKTNKSDVACVRSSSSNDTPSFVLEVGQALLLEINTIRYLDEHGGDCSAMDLITRVVRPLANDRKSTFFLGTNLSSYLKTLKASNVSFQNTQEKIIRRRYHLLNSVERLCTYLLRQPEMIFVRNWNEAKEILSPFFIFPDTSEFASGVSSNGQSTATRNRDVSRSDPILERYERQLLLRRIDSLSIDLPPSQRLRLAIAENHLYGKSFETANVADVQHAQSMSAQGQLLHDAQRMHDKSTQNKHVPRIETELELQEEAVRRASDLMRPLDNEEQALVQEGIYGHGSDSQVMAEDGADTVLRSSLRKLAPRRWLNDEIIHFFFTMLAKRDEELCSTEQGRKRCHFFKSFFVTKLINEGHERMDGVYEYRNVKRWSKKVPGSDIFALNKIFFPINVGQSHWVCAVIFMQAKRIQFYDSMGGDGEYYLSHLFRYLQDEHEDKKKMPLPDVEEWELVPCCYEDTPQQENGYDCGVFTCMYADFLSKDCPLVFEQKHITLCRERITLAILNGRAIM